MSTVRASVLWGEGAQSQLGGPQNQLEQSPSKLLRKLKRWEGLGSSRVSLRVSWEGLRASWEGPEARWEGPEDSWEGLRARGRP